LIGRESEIMIEVAKYQSENHIDQEVSDGDLCHGDLLFLQHSTQHHLRHRHRWPKDAGQAGEREG